MSDRKLQFRAYRTGDKTAVITLLSGGRSISYASEKAAVFDWQFFGNPERKGRPAYLIGVLAEEVVAVNGFTPVTIKYRGKSELGCWSLDTYVSANHRGLGIGKALAELVSLSAPVMLGYGISDMNDPILQRLNWELDTSMSVMFYHSSEPGLLGLAKNVLSHVAQIKPARPHDRRRQVTVEACPAVSELDTLWRRVEHQFENAVQRTGSYISWRYRDAPNHRYVWIVARSEGALKGLLIIRHHPQESVIADYLGPIDAPDLLLDLVASARSVLTSAGTRRIRCETTCAAIKQALADTGFIRSRTTSRFRVRHNLPPASESDSSWFVMTGDSDNDLLTL